MAESDLVEAKLFLRGGLSINHAAREEWEEGFSKMCTDRGSLIDSFDFWLNLSLNNNF